MVFIFEFLIKIWYNLNTNNEYCKQIIKNLSQIKIKDSKNLSKLKIKNNLNVYDKGYK